MVCHISQLSCWTQFESIHPQAVKQEDTVVVVLDSRNFTTHQNDRVIVRLRIEEPNDRGTTRRSINDHTLGSTYFIEWLECAHVAADLQAAGTRLTTTRVPRYLYVSIAPGTLFQGQTMLSASCFAGIVSCWSLTRPRNDICTCWAWALPGDLYLDGADEFGAYEVLFALVVRSDSQMQ